ncbi:MAG: hypothetical protein QCI82_04290 [Candidatus Thermoplasmatota archaeon]|nr:hypothetical protein [Candidatus Thermoplasmatota archaeon]
MIGIENLLFSAYTALSFVLLLVAILAYRRSRSSKVLILTGAFLLFFVKGALLTLVLFLDLMGMLELLLAGTAIDTIALMLLYASTLRV